MHCTKCNKSFYKIKDLKQCMLKIKWKKRTINKYVKIESKNFAYHIFLVVHHQFHHRILMTGTLQS